MKTCTNCGSEMISGAFPSSSGWCKAECDLLPKTVAKMTESTGTAIGTMEYAVTDDGALLSKGDVWYYYALDVYNPYVLKTDGVLDVDYRITNTGYHGTLEVLTKMRVWTEELLPT